MKKAIRIITLPFRLLIVQFLEWLIRRHDDYNENFRKFNL